MSEKEDLKRFAKLGFEDFRRLASDSSLSAYEKIGFPNSYRKGKEPEIFADMLKKLPALLESEKVVLDIGPGCSDIPRLLIAHCRSQRHDLYMVDSEEMLAQLEDADDVHKIAGFYPECPDLVTVLYGRTDVVIVYSVLHYVFIDTNLWKFLDTTLSLLSPGGAVLLGDIPNISMRKRFFDSGTGKKFHREFTARNEDPELVHNQVVPDQIDDSVIFAILMRARAAGYHGYVLPQAPTLPLANRREDILIIRP